MKCEVFLARKNYQSIKIMKYSISNKFFQVEVQQKGAELCSIKSLTTDKEYMWDANPDVWGSFAPVLFPIIGCLKNKETEYEGNKYAIPKHGFVRHNSNIELKYQSSNELVFVLKYNSELLKVYPFKFEFEISFKLVENKIIVRHKVVNLDSKEMLFSLGGHPGFKCPVNENENYSDYYLEFEHQENEATYDLTSDGFVEDTTRPVLNNTNILPLTSSMFDDDALIFKTLKSRKVTLKSKKSTQQLSVSFNDFDYLGIWAKPNADFICIEPWLGIADADNTDGLLKNKEGIRRLEPSKQLKAEFIIEIKE